MEFDDFYDDYLDLFSKGFGEQAEVFFRHKMMKEYYETHGGRPKDFIIHQDQ